jgi:rSAM/selenodomain-associated transferase 2/rSAM/selenodomain-associated transferase 1
MYSFIIITYNESVHIASVIESIHESAQGFDYEVIVSDGGSNDGTIEILKSLNVKYIDSDPGRGVQLRRAAQRAAGDVYIFLHGDTMFPIDGLQVIHTYFNNKGAQAATFRMGFDQSNLLYVIFKWFTKFDTIFTSFGDQCITVTRELYQKTGGFPSWQLFEDVQFLRKVRRQTKIVSLPSTVTTSARRFKQHGIIRQMLRNFWMIIGFFLGLNHHKLKSIYSKKKLKQESALILFARYPVEGKVKTRLAKSIGDSQAAAFYEKSVEHCLATVKKLPFLSTYVFVAEEEDLPKMKQWLGDDLKIRAQSSGDLGRRMHQAFRELKEGYGKIAIIGTDVPDISETIINKAFLALDKVDFVIGPSDDGGYYLIGLKENSLEIFEDIDWSTDMVLKQTLDKITNMDCSYQLLERLIDIDFNKDVIKWLELSRNKNHPLVSWIREAKLI